MHVAVCIKQILDPEVPPRQFQVDPERKDARRGNAALVIGPFDLNALEVAVQLKEKAGAKVTVLTLGGPDAKEALKRALAMGCDQAIHIDAEDRSHDGATTARLLAAGVRRLEDADVVFCGRQSGDWDQGMVGSLLAEELGMPAIPFARKVEASREAQLRLECEVDGGVDLLEAGLPILATITNSEENAPRLPKVKEIMMAGRKPMQRLTPAELGVEGDALQPRVEILSLTVPVSEGACEFVEGETGTEKGEALVQRLRARKAI